MYQIPSFVQVRLPVQPIGFSERVVASLQGKDTYAAIHSLLSTASLAEAIADSSPNLYRSWLDSKTSGSLSEEQVQALLKYLYRALCRATPYGRLAGVGVAALQTATGLSFQTTPAFAFHQRYDSAVLCALAAELELDYHVRTRLTYRLNNSLYQAGGQWRFSERDASGTGGQITLLTYTNSDVLQEVVSFMKAHQLVSWQGLVGRLAAQFSQYDAATLEDYVHHLVNSGFLASSLQVPVTGLPMQVYLQQELVRLGLSPDQFKDVASQQSQLNKTQTDTVITSALSVSTSLVCQLTHELNTVQPLLVSAVSATLTDFKRRFVRRYEGARVPLLEVLDPVYGIQYEVSNRLEESWLNRWPVDTIAPSSGTITPLNMLDYVLSQSKQEVGAAVDLGAFLNKYPLSTSVPFPTAVSVMGEMFVGYSG
jgi:lantibiotic biosynthesis protein